METNKEEGKKEEQRLGTNKEEGEKEEQRLGTNKEEGEKEEQRLVTYVHTVETIEFQQLKNNQLFLKGNFQSRNVMVLYNIKFLFTVTTHDYKTSTGNSFCKNKQSCVKRECWVKAGRVVQKQRKLCKKEKVVQKQRKLCKTMEFYKETLSSYEER